MRRKVCGRFSGSRGLWPRFSLERVSEGVRFMMCIIKARVASHFLPLWLHIYIYKVIYQVPYENENIHSSN